VTITSSGTGSQTTSLTNLPVTPSENNQPSTADSSNVNEKSVKEVSAKEEGSNKSNEQDVADVSNPSKTETLESDTSHKVFAELKVILPEKGERTYHLRKGDNIIGRSDQCNVYIPGKHLSKQHAVISIVL